MIGFDFSSIFIKAEIFKTGQIYVHDNLSS